MRPLENLKKYKIILASNSPRRRQLLGDLGIGFDTLVIPGIDESYPDDIATEDISCYISQKKAAAYRSSVQADTLVITADTIVACGDKVLGKPHSEEEARQMLRELSGKVHKVITGVTITTAARGSSSFKSVSEVEFAELSDEEISYYVSQFKPMDKAGAYGIQEWIGCIGVKGINGSFYNVMGLPVQRLYEELKKY